MEESVTYQAILARGEADGEAKGRAAEARNLILRLGTRRFGPLSPSAETAVQAISSVEQLEELAGRLLEVEIWDELPT